MAHHFASTSTDSAKAANTGNRVPPFDVRCGGQGKRASVGSGLIAIEYHAPASPLSTTDPFDLERFVTAQAVDLVDLLRRREVAPAQGWIFLARQRLLTGAAGRASTTGR